MTSTDGRAPLTRRTLATVGVGTLLLLNLVIHGYRMSDEAAFNVDVERDLTRALGLVTGRAYPFEGPALSDTGLNLGSLYYLLLAPLVALSPDPLFLRWAFVIFATGALGLLAVVLLRRRVRLEVAFVALAWLVASELWYDAQLWLWHSTLLPVFVAGLLVAVERVTSGGSVRWLWAAAALAATTLSLHVTALATLPVLAVTVVLVRSRLSWRTGLAALAAFAVPLIPLGLGLLAVRDAEHVAFARREAVDPPAVSSLLEYAAAAFLPGMGTRRLYGAFPVMFGIPWLMVVLPGLALVGAAHAWRRTGQAFERLLTLGLGVGLVLAALLLGRELALRYLVLVALPLVLLAALGLDRLLGAWADRLPVRLALAAAALALVIPGLTRDTSGLDDVGAACRMVTQRAVAKEVVDVVGIPAVDVDRRVHGTVCRNATSGFRYFYRVRPQSMERAQAARERDTHVLVTSAAMTQDANAVVVYSEATLATPGGGTRVVAYRPAVDYRALRRWREATAAGPQDRLSIPVVAGAEQVRIDVRGRGVAACRIALVAPASLTMDAPTGSDTYRGVRVLVPSGAAPVLEVTVGPCAGIESIDVQ